MLTRFTHYRRSSWSIRVHDDDTICVGESVIALKSRKLRIVVSQENENIGY
jgi:hypothetical protein